VTSRLNVAFATMTLLCC